MSDIFDHIVSRNNLTQAWLAVRKKGSTGGIDKVTIESFDKKSGEFIDELAEKLTSGKYVPEPYQRIFIAKNDADFRQLGLPTITDKIVQNSAKWAIEPIFEKMFLNNSYGYRPGKGPVKAINRVRDYIGSGKCTWVSIADIDNFFDTINPDLLFQRLAPVLNSQRLIDLLKLWVKIGSVNFKFRYEGYRKGVPQGSVISPMLANFYLHPFDKFITEKKYGLVRYADDFVILTKSHEQAKAALSDARWFLQNDLKLRLNKAQVVKKVANKFEFLHILFTGTKTSVSDDRLFTLYQKIDNGITIKGHIPDIERLTRALNGIRAYYARLIPTGQLEKIDLVLCDSLKKKLANALVRKQILRKQDIRNFLGKIEFLSLGFNSNRQKHTAEIMEYITGKTKPAKALADEKLTKLIEKKRAKYEALADAGRELVITTPGVFIGKTQKGITVKHKGVKKMDYPLHNLKHIVILSRGTTLSSNVIHYCASNKIPIDFLGFNGIPYAKLYAPLYPDGGLGLQQQAALENGKGVQFMKYIVEGKIKNQLGLIKYYYKYRKDKDAEYAEAYVKHMAEMEKAQQKVEDTQEISVKKVRPVFTGYEGHASAFYWDMMVRLLNEYVVFEKRERQGATDLVNSMLNYGYAILYSRVWEAVIRARLNPHISFMHAPQPGRPTLAFDLIEEFRQQAVDKTVFALITKGEDMKVEKGLLTHKTKTRLTTKIIARLNRKENFRGKKLRLLEIIHHQAKAMAGFIQGISKYKPYVAKW